MQQRSIRVWLRNQREHLHQLALEALLQLAEDSLASGDFGTALTLAQRQLVLEPWREQAHRQLMYAYARMGDRSNALTQFERCREQLWDEIGIEPAPETAELSMISSPVALVRLRPKIRSHRPPNRNTIYRPTRRCLSAESGNRLDHGSIYTKSSSGW